MSRFIPAGAPSHERPGQFQEQHEHTLARIRQLAAKEFSINSDALDPNAPLDSLGVDSLNFIEFMFKVEEEFGVGVSDEELKSIKTLADLERHVASALATARSA